MANEPDDEQQHGSSEEGVPDTVDSALRFAADLRALRLQADSPTLVRLQHETGISRSVISEALSGRQLPSARTVDRLVRTLGAESAPWLERRDAIALTLVAADTQASEDAPAEPRRVRLGIAAGIAVAALLIGSIGGGIAGGLLSHALLRDELNAANDALANTTEHAQVNVRSGLDPALTPCVEDAKVATGVTRENVKVEIIWSNKC